jgi:hypothetical protein
VAEGAFFSQNQNVVHLESLISINDTSDYHAARELHPMMLLNPHVFRALVAATTMFWSTTSAYDTMQFQLCSDDKCSIGCENQAIGQSQVDTCFDLAEYRKGYSVHIHHVDPYFFGKNMRLYTFEGNKCEGIFSTKFRLTNNANCGTQFDDSLAIRSFILHQCTANCD